ncbi:MAG: ribosomal L7Ae/L30e/S12e/Gadd45 family protein [Lachnospiraceae bacterium]|nr:ribosomal L7Ae/L30e/S12e/Gadd45 family protein [Lachnospiraceae bacterium]
MKPDKVLSMLGIATKANGVVSGEFMTEQAIKSGEACLVIVAEDASDNTKKMFRNSCEFYQVKLVCYGTKESLGHSIGKEFRASLAITNEGLADAVCKKLAQITTE